MFKKKDYSSELARRKDGKKLMRSCKIRTLMRTLRQNDFVRAKPHAKLTTGEVIRMLRELKGWTQAELARRKISR